MKLPLKAWLFGGAVAVAGTIAGPAGAVDVQFSIYGGSNSAHNSKVNLQRPDGTNATFTGVEWDAKPFDIPFYYGGRTTLWLDGTSGWGAGVEFTHAKVYARLTRTVGASGTIAGVPVGPNVVLGNVFSVLEFSDGLNLVTAHVAYRYNMGSVKPYAGLGLGVAIPHVEVTTAGFPRTFDYQASGIAVRAFAGVEVPIYGGWSAFGEYQFTYSDVSKAPLVGGGILTTEVLNHHLNFGISYAFKLF